MKLINQSEHSVKLSHIIVEGLPVPQRANVLLNLSSVRKFVSSRSSLFSQCKITLFLRGVIFKFRVSVVPKMTISNSEGM